MVIPMSGLGKKRTPLGIFLDETPNISQEWLSIKTGKNRDTISDLCDGNKNVKPRIKTKQLIISVLRKYGYNVKSIDFWE